MMISRRLWRENRNLYVCSLCNNGLRSACPVAWAHARRWASDSSSNGTPPKSSGWGSSGFVPRAPARPSTTDDLSDHESAARRAILGSSSNKAPAPSVPSGPGSASRDSPAPPKSSDWGSSGFVPRAPARSSTDSNLSDRELAARRSLLSSSGNSGQARGSSFGGLAGMLKEGRGQPDRRPSGGQGDGRRNRPDRNGPGWNSSGGESGTSRRSPSGPAAMRGQGPTRMGSRGFGKNEDFWGNFGGSGSSSRGPASGKSEDNLPNWNSLPRRPRRDAENLYNRQSGAAEAPRPRLDPTPDTSQMEQFEKFAKAKSKADKASRPTRLPDGDWAAKYSKPQTRQPVEEKPYKPPRPSTPTPAKPKEADNAPSWGSRQANSRDRYAPVKPKKGRVGGPSRRGVEEDEDFDEEAEMLAEERRRQKAAEKAARKAARQAGEQTHSQLFLPEYIGVTDLARALKIGVTDFLRALEEYGFDEVHEDSIFTGETAGLVAQEFGFDVKVDDGMARDLRPEPEPEDSSSVPSRPPVVAIMGHVDHGKTTLLDYLRKSSIVAGEHGGITQHIGAFSVNMSSGKSITFLDTPGHAAFLSMRQRGAEVTDIVILVVAADDSVMPQTVEALKHVRAAKVPMIVAITKCDKEDARIEQVKSDLSNHGVEIEDYGGDVQVVPVSGKTGQGMSDLEENILTLSEILDVRGDPNGLAEGWVLEASVKPVGKVATVLIKRGTLRIGDYLVCGTVFARVRVLRNEAGQEIDEAPPGSPVEVLGWRDELPQAGDRALQAPDESKARNAVDYRREMKDRESVQKQVADTERQRKELEAKAAREAVASDEAVEAETGVATVNFIVRADVVGSVEAVTGTILGIGNNEVQPRILRSAAGHINEWDVEYAAMSRSIIVNFNIGIPAHVKSQAEEAGVQIIDRSVIYHVADDVKAELSARLPDAVSQRVLGEAEVLQVFPINVRGRVFKNIAGCKIRNGAVKKTDMVRIYRKGEKVFDGKLESLKHGKKDVPEMKKGSECGVGCVDFQDIQPGDQLQAYETVREKRSL